MLVKEYITAIVKVASEKLASEERGWEGEHCVRACMLLPQN